MPNDNPEGIGGSLSLSEAAAAYATPANEEEAPEGQSESEEPAEDDAELDADQESDEEPGEDDPEGQAEEDPPENEPEAPAYAANTAKVKLPDGSEATVDDLIKGNLRDRDYRQKTQALSSEKEAFKAKASEIQQLEKSLAEDRDWTIQLVQSLMPQKPDYSLASVDPVGYAEAKAFYDARKEQLDYLVYQANQTQQRTTAEQEKARNEKKASEWQATLEVMPELKDSKRLASFVTDIQGELTKAGYSPAEISEVGMDHRQLPIIRDAIAYRKLQANKSKVAAKVEGRPPVQRGGTRPTPEAQRTRDSRAAMDRLKSSGSIKDGVAALLALEKG